MEYMYMQHIYGGTYVDEIDEQIIGKNFHLISAYNK